MVRACHHPPGPGAHTLGGCVWPTCHIVGSGSTPVTPGSLESVYPRSSRAGRGWEGTVGTRLSARTREKPGSLPALSTGGRHLAWEQPHLLRNLQREEGRVSAVALTTTLSHCNEAGRGRRLVLKEHETHRSAFQRGLGGSSAPSQGEDACGTTPTGPRPSPAQGLLVVPQVGKLAGWKERQASTRVSRVYAGQQRGVAVSPAAVTGRPASASPKGVNQSKEPGEPAGGREAGTGSPGIRN